MTYNSRHGGFGMQNNRSSSSSSSRGRSKRPQGLNEDLYTKAAKEADVEIPTADKIDFSSYGLSPQILESLTKRGYHHPTEIQAKTIAGVLAGKDVVAISQTGSGKTGGFLIPLLNEIKKSQDAGVVKKALIVAPTRELAYQIDKELREFNLKRLNLFSLVCVGGMSIGDQMHYLRKTNHFVIGTPGRLVDLAKRGFLKLDDFNMVVLDEMDRMLEMGFVEDITWIVDQIPQPKQSLYFSATLNSAIRPILSNMSPDAVYVELQKPEPSRYVDQTMVAVTRGNKLTTLVSILKDPEVTKALVFVATKSMVETVAEELARQEVLVDFIHGDKTQSSRMRVIEGFKKVKSGVLVATDVAARGLDVNDISHVINFDEPKTREDYIHRIGRTGRNGKFGKAITMVNR